MPIQSHSNSFYALLIAVVLASAFGSIGHAETLQGAPRIIDGDTLVLEQQVVRLHGIDAAESGQRCVAASRQLERPGDAAENRLAALSKDGVVCTGSERDAYARLLATCKTTTGVEINRALVAEGLAWAFIKYSRDYVKDESQAKSASLGVWAMRCDEPWVFREKRWNVAAEKAPNGCAIKGNISGNGHIYHTPWSRHYTRTRVNLTKGERWFCSEGEAMKAGWRAPIR